MFCGRLNYFESALCLIHNRLYLWLELLVQELEYPGEVVGPYSPAFIPGAGVQVRFIIIIHRFPTNQ